MNKGHFVCNNKECFLYLKYINKPGFLFKSERERKNCPSCKKPMIKKEIKKHHE